jgi:hypothetical protein
MQVQMFFMPSFQKKRNFLQNKTSFYLFEKVSSNDRKGLGHFPASQVRIYPVQGV